MKYLRYFCLVLIFVVLAGSVQTVSAQDYRFQVPDEAAVVTINTDGSIAIDYTMTFKNDAGAHPIDIVDVGMPNSNYVLTSMTADVDSKKITKITNSDVVNPGISLYLQGNEIPAGGSGTVHLHVGTVNKVIYPATQTESEPYGSFQFSPNWFDSQYCYGQTNLQVTFLFPTGLQTTETRYYKPEGGWPGPTEPESQLMSNGRIFYTWVASNANAYTQYTFGASFPARVLSSGAIVTSPYVPPSGSSGSSGISFNLNSLCPFVFCLGFLGFFGVTIYAATAGAKKRKLQYLPPKISMEGHGIKRGLTAVEAGILMEQPMDKIMTMTLFGLLKKNAAEVITKDPLEVKAASPLPADLYGYETDFMAAFGTQDKTERRKLLQNMMVNLIRSVGEKMKGFSKKETVAFYQDIIKRAWDQVQQAATPEVKGQVYEDVMDWTMLDKNYEQQTSQTFSGPIFIPVPIWWWRYDPGFPRPTSFPNASTAVPTSIPTSMPGGVGHVSLPSLPGSAFAASVVGGVQNFSSGVLGNLSSFTSGVTNVTNPVPPPSTYRSIGGGGGGHSCACACACAGCACACAGGGR